MGKNLGGGGNHKKFARKRNEVGSIPKSNRLRESSCPEEIYAVATKMLGNNMFSVHCIDDQDRLCHIPSRFSKQFKRQSMVSVGTWVLVGKNEFTLGSRKNACTLLEVYTDSEKRQLQSDVKAPWHILEPATNTASVEENFVFSNAAVMNDEEEEEEEKKEANEKQLITLVAETGVVEEGKEATRVFVVDVDDI